MNAAVGSWSAAYELQNIAIPTNAFFQVSTQTIALSTLGVTADNLYQFELTRRVTGVTGTNLAAAFNLVELTLEYS
jgi:aspartate ammonia-lyase